MRKMGCVILVMVLLVGILPAGQAAQLEVAGKSAVLMDGATGTVLYEKNAHEKLAPASVTKVMTMLLIMEAIDSGKICWEDMVTASETAASKGGSQIFLKAGESMTVTEMVKSIAVSSANDAACAMAEHIAGSEAAFVGLMNKRAGELGMNDTNFVNCTGLDDDPEAKDHLTSAYDIALMSRELLVKHPKIKEFTTIWMDTIRDGAFGLSNTNKLVRFYKGCTGLKTGFTSGAGFCLAASALREEQELIAVVLGAESSQDRFEACKQLLDYGFANYSLVRPEVTGENAVAVKLGTVDMVEAVPAELPQLLIDKAQRGEVNVKVELEEAVTAPVSRGQKLGTLTIRVGDQVVAQVNMVAKDAVPKLTWWQIFVRLMQRITMAA